MLVICYKRVGNMWLYFQWLILKVEWTAMGKEGCNMSLLCFGFCVSKRKQREREFCKRESSFFTLDVVFINKRIRTYL